MTPRAPKTPPAPGLPDCPVYGTTIARALATEGGHLSVRHNSFTLWFGWGARLHGYDKETALVECTRAGLPIIDARAVPFADLWRLAAAGPMIAVGEPASPEPWGPLSYAPLAAVARAHLAAGATVLHLSAADGAGEEGGG